MPKRNDAALVSAKGNRRRAILLTDETVRSGAIVQDGFSQDSFAFMRMYVPEKSGTILPEMHHAQMCICVCARKCAHGILRET